MAETSFAKQIVVGVVVAVASAIILRWINLPQSPQPPPAAPPTSAPHSTGPTAREQESQKLPTPPPTGKKGSTVRPWSPVYIGAFPEGSAELTAAQKKEIDVVVAAVNATDPKPKSIQVIGFAPNVGETDDNNDLAGKRAIAARDYLILRLKETAPSVTMGKATPDAPAPTSKRGDPVVAADVIEPYVGGQSAYVGHWPAKIPKQTAIINIFFPD